MPPPHVGDALSLTTLGLRTWSPGPVGLPTVAPEADAVLSRALERGIGWVEIAASPDTGMHQVVRRARARDHSPGVVLALGDTGASGVVDPAQIAAQTEAAITECGIDVIDVGILHVPEGRDPAALWACMTELVDRGRLRNAGVAARDTELVARCLQVGPVALVQTHVSLIARGTAPTVLPWCTAQEIPAMVSSPLEQGLLTGHFTAERAASLGADDCRSRSPQFHAPCLARNLTLAEAVRDVAASHNRSPAAVAIAWALSWPGVRAAAVGARTTAQLDAWADAAGVRLGDTDLDELAAAVVATGAGVGPKRPPTSPGGLSPARSPGR